MSSTATFAFTLAALVTLGQSQFPKVCLHNATVGDAVCCPIPPGLSEPCGGPARGHCTRLPEVEEIFKPDIHPMDDRLKWPHRFFHYACQCEANYAGYMCQECRFGFRGTNCQEKHEAVRHNVMQMSDAKKEQFRRVVDMSKRHPSDYVVMTNVWDVDPITEPRFQEVSVYDFFVWIHAYAARVPVTTEGGEPMACNLLDLRIQQDFAHQGPGFLPWHRLYLLQWERAMQTLSGEEDFTFPYWDWVDKGSDCEVCTNDIIGATDYTDAGGDYTNPDGGRLQSESPFSTWNTTMCQQNFVYNNCSVCNASRPGMPLRRIPAVNPLGTGRLPDRRELDFTMSQTRYYEEDPDDPDYLKHNFGRVLEGGINENGTFAGKLTMHGEGHFFFWGQMGWSVGASPNDPAFILHHTFIDKLFEEWFREFQPGVEQLPATGMSPGHNRFSAVVPFFPVWLLSELFTDSRNLGYDYEEINYYSERNAQKLSANLNSALREDEQPSHKQSGWVTGLVAGLVACVILGSLILLILRGRRKSRQEVMGLAQDASETTSLVKESEIVA